MRAFLPIVVVAAALAAVPLFVHANVVLNFLVVTLLIAGGGVYVLARVLRVGMLMLP